METYTIVKCFKCNKYVEKGKWFSCVNDGAFQLTFHKKCVKNIGEYRDWQKSKKEKK